MKLSTPLNAVLLAVAALLTGAGFARAVVIERTSSAVMYIDAGAGYTGHYAAYRVTNDGPVDLVDVDVTAGSFAGGAVSLGSGEDGTYRLGSLPAGTSRTGFFYLRASGTATGQTHTISVLEGGSPVGAASYSLEVEETLQANANKLVTVLHGPDPAELGGILTMTVSGETGNIGAGGILVFTPAAAANWPADAYELVSTEITLSGGNNAVLIDSLAVTGASPAKTDYVGVYRFRVTSTTTAPTQVSPVAYISSGNKVKHTGSLDFTFVPPIDPAVSALVLTKTSDVGSLPGAGRVTYTVRIENQGTADATLDAVVDMLPTVPDAAVYVTGSTAWNGVARGDPTASGDTLVWSGALPVPAGGSAELRYQTDLPATGGTYVNRAWARVGVERIDTTLDTADDAAGEAPVTVVSGTTVSGRIYRDLQPDGIADAGEDWAAGEPVFVNLIQGSTVLASVAVTPGAGTYTLSGVDPGTYRVVVAVTDTATTGGISGWTPTNPTDGSRSVLVAAVPVTAQDFGFFHGIRLTGRVFQDDGAGGGFANNAVLDGGENGLPAVRLRLVAAGIPVDSTWTDGTGAYTFWLAESAGYGPLVVEESNPAGYLSVGGSPGTTGGTYDRTADAMSYVHVSGIDASEVDFGDVPVNVFGVDAAATAPPDTTVVYAHTFTAGSAGAVTFTSSALADPPGEPWSHVLIRDLDCNGVADPGDPAIGGAIAMTAGETVCLLVLETVPVSAPVDARDLITVTATFDYTGAAPALATAHAVTDLTQVGYAVLSLLKTADKASALPGETITYTLAFTNDGSETVSDVRVDDATPAFTTFVSADPGTVPPSLSLSGIVQPGPGTAGSVTWTFAGTLAPGDSGTVSFVVRID